MWIIWILLALFGCGVALGAARMQRVAERERKREIERIESLPVAAQIRYRLLMNESQRLVTAGHEAQACRHYNVAMACYDQAQRIRDQANRLLNSTK